MRFFVGCVSDVGVVGVVMDMTKLEFPAGSFDVVIDKCAMDALLVDEGDPWNPKEEIKETVDKMMTGISQFRFWCLDPGFVVCAVA